MHAEQQENSSRSQLKRKADVRKLLMKGKFLWFHFHYWNWKLHALKLYKQLN